MTPERRPPAAPIAPTAFLPSENTVIYWLSGAGFLIHSRTCNLIIDPVLTRDREDPSRSECGLPLKVEIPLAAQDVPANCTVLYTHADADHLGPATARILAEKRLTMVGTLSVFERLVRLGVPPEQITVLRTGERFKLSPVTVESTPADHPWQLKDRKRGGRPYRMGDCCGFLLDSPDGSMYFPGDTRLMEEHLRMQGVDLLALDVSTCEYHLNHTSAAVLANHHSRADLLPFHYGTYDCPGVAAHCGEPEEVFQNVTDADSRGHILAPGEPFLLCRHCGAPGGT